MLEVRNLTFEKRLQGISLTCKPGEIHALFGANGSGKSTFLKSVMGLLPLSFEQVFWNGEPLHLKPRIEISRIASWLPQQLQVPFEYTVEEFVAMGRYMHRNKGSLDQFLEKVDVLPWKNRLLHTLSQGERQRVYLARILATESPLLLLDEPQAHLDLGKQKKFWSLIQLLASEGKTVIVANHDLQSSQKYCTHIALLEQGRCIQHRPVSELDIPSFFP